MGVRKRFAWVLVLCAVALVSMVAGIAVAESSTHLIRWKRGSSATITGDTMKVVPPNNASSTHVLEVQFSFSTPVDVGGAVVCLPASIFTGWDGATLVGTAAPAISNENDVDPNQPLQYPFLWRLDSQTNEIVIYNAIPMDAGYSMSVEVAYTVYPHQVLQTPQQSGLPLYHKDDIQAHFSLNETETYASNLLTLIYDTQADLSSAYKEAQAYRQWDTAWGPAPADANQYVYVRWRIASLTGTNDSQAFELFIQETNAQGYPGELFAFSNSKTGFQRATMEEFEAAHSPANIITWPTTLFSSGDNTFSHFVYFRYRLSDIENNPAYYNQATRQITLSNKAHVQVKSQEGTITEREIQASVKVLDPRVPLNPPGNTTTFDKKNWGVSRGMINYIEDGKEPLKLGMYPGTMPFYIYDASFTGWQNSWDGSIFGAKEYYVVIQDSTLMFFNPTNPSEHTRVPLGQGDYKFVNIAFSGWQEYGPDNSALFTHKARPVEEHGTVEVQAAYPLPDGTKTYKPIGNITKHVSPSGTVSYQYTSLTDPPSLVVSAGGRLTIPIPANAAGEGALGFRLVLKTSAVYTTFGAVYMDIHLLPSEKVKDYIAHQIVGNPASAPRNEATVYNLAQRWMMPLDAEPPANPPGTGATHLLTRVVGQSELGKTVVNGSLRVDLANQQYSVEYLIRQNEYVEHPDPSVDNLLQDGFVIEQRDAVFHDLLAPGVTVDLSTIRVTAYSMQEKKDIQIPHRIEVVENWRGMGRNLMRVIAHVPEDVVNIRSFTNGGYNNVYSGMTLRYRQYNTFANVSDYGRKLTNYLVYESLNGALNKGVLDDATYLGPLVDLYDDGPSDPNAPKRFMYTRANHEYVGSVASILGIDKAVSSVEAPEWRNTARTTEAGNYSYRLRYQNGTTTTSKDIVLYDLLETAHGGNQHWQGSLWSVNTLQPQGKGVDVKPYYTTRADFALSPEHLDNNLGTIWQPLTEGTDMSTVKAVAFDLRRKVPAAGQTVGDEYLLPPGESLQVMLYMQAPVEAKEHILNQNKAYNLAYSDSRKRDMVDPDFDKDTALEHCNVVTVTLEDMKLKLNKESTPVSGTADAPSPVQAGDSVVYKLSLANNNLVQVAEQITLEDSIPAGMTVDFAGIQASFAHDPAGSFAVLPDEASKPVRLISAPGSSQLVFLVNRLHGGEVVNITIPTTVDTPVGIPQDTEYINKAQVT